MLPCHMSTHLFQISHLYTITVLEKRPLSFVQRFWRGLSDLLLPRAYLNTKKSLQRAGFSPRAARKRTNDSFADMQGEA